LRRLCYGHTYVRTIGGHTRCSVEYLYTEV
jgi:hypothetical protein